MEIYLIRHTKPAVAKGICYGQADIDVAESFLEEAALIKQYIPTHVSLAYSSPLQRCKKLADYLFNPHQVLLHPELMEINCGEWELMHWDAIPAEALKPWMNAFVEQRIPGGESYIDLFERTTRRFNHITNTGDSAAIVCHGGVIRSILAHITHTPLIDSFKVFPLHYGCVAKITLRNGKLYHQMLLNNAAEPEQHKPSSFYTSK